MPKYTDAQKQQWAEQRQQQLSAITDLLEQGVAEVFTSEKYMEYPGVIAQWDESELRGYFSTDCSEISRESCRISRKLRAIWRKIDRKAPKCSLCGDA